MAFANETLASAQPSRRMAAGKGLRLGMLVAPALISAAMWCGLIEAGLKLIQLV
jgi:hypothetical protein